MIILTATVEALHLAPNGDVAARLRYNDPDFNESDFVPEVGVPLYKQDKGDYIRIEAMYPLNPNCQRLNQSNGTLLIGDSILVSAAVHNVCMQSHACRPCLLPCAFNPQNSDSPEPIKVYPVEP